MHIQNHHGNLDLLAFWLANTCRLMHNLRQYSGEQVRVTVGVCRSVVLINYN